MRFIHRATLTTLAKPEEDVEAIRKGIIALVPFDMEKAKVQLQVQNAEGFDHRTIKIFTIILTKEAHTNDFLDFFLIKLTDEQKRLLISQTESRLDDNLDFFIRIDKDRWIAEREIWLTDTGYCFHIKLSLAAYPKNRQTAHTVVEKIFSQKNI